METFSFSGLATPLQILLVDLLLGADNALLIGLASRALPPKARRRAAAFGVVGAVALRLLTTTVAASLFARPFVKLIGALVLMLIALKLAEDRAEEPVDFGGDEDAPARLWRTAAVIVAADAVMSLDNVVALAAIAQGNFLWLLIGVGLSLPMLGYGGLLVAETLHRAPGLAAFGAALLGWIAGGMAVSDASWAEALATNAPGLVMLAPSLAAAFVYLHSLWATRPARVLRAVAPRPLRAAPAPPAKAVPAAPPKPLAEPLHKPVELSRLEGRLMIVGLALLFLIAGGFLAVAAYYGGLE